MDAIAKMPTYEAYKDSEISSLGNVPDHWAIERIKHDIELLTGFPFESSKYSDEGIKLARGINVKEGRFDWRDTAFWPEVSNNLKEYLLEAGDILIGMDGSKVGKNFCYVSGSDLPVLLLQRVARLRAKPSLSSAFLYWCVASSRFLSWVNQSKTDPMVPHIAPKDITGYVIAYPPFEEQTLIANFLDQKTAQIDEAIAIKEQQIALLKERKQIIIQKAVTQGLDPDVPMKDSGVDWIGEIPVHWTVRRFKHMGKIINGYAYPSEEFLDHGIRVMKIANIQSMRLDWTDSSYIGLVWLHKTTGFQVFRGDLVFALTRPVISTGIKAALVDSDEPILLNQRNAVFRPTSFCERNWIYFILLAKKFIGSFEMQIDTTGQQPNISTNAIGNLALPVPQPEEQRLITEWLFEQCSDIDTAMHAQESQIAKLKEYKATLINSAVTGKIRITPEMVA